MAITIEQAFRKLFLRIEPYDMGFDVATKHRYLGAQIKHHIRIDDDLHIGSYG